MFVLRSKNQIHRTWTHRKTTKLDTWRRETTSSHFTHNKWLIIIIETNNSNPIFFFFANAPENGEQKIKPWLESVVDLHFDDPLTAPYFGPHKFDNNGSRKYVKKQVLEFFSAELGSVSVLARIWWKLIRMKIEYSLPCIGISRRK